MLVVEELDDILEEHIRALGIACDGRDVVPGIGELSVDRLLAAKARHGGKPAAEQEPRCPRRQDLPARPPVLCPGCPHRGVFYALGKYDVIVTGDIGCYSLGASAASGAHGHDPVHGRRHLHGPRHGEGRRSRARSSASSATRPSSTPASPACWTSPTTAAHSTIIVVDNRTTAMTGHQDHPGTGRTLQGQPSIAVKIEDIGRACGIKRVCG